MTTSNFKGKSVIITGGSSGIGLSIATYFATHGAHISIFDLDKNGSYVASDLQSKHAGSKVEFYTCDVVNWETQAAAFKKVWEKEGAVHYVFANAGIAQDEFYRPDEGEPVKPNLKTLDVCLNGAMYTVHLAVHYMRRSKESWKGMIICTASDAGLYGFHPAPIYGAAKHGVVGMVRALGRTMKEEGIMVNGLAPNYLVSNLSAPEIAEYQIPTPMTSIVKAVHDLVSKPTSTGMISEVSGDDPGFYYREQVSFPDETTVKNFEGWWELT